MGNRETEPIETRLDSWKEIAAYLQRQTKTVRRWEREEGLPVHRHSHKSRSSVYAYPSEIEAWRVSRKVVAEPAPAPARPLWRVPAFVLTVAACLVMVGNGIRPQVASAQQHRPVVKRALCSGCGDREASFSRDGRVMVFTDWDTGDLALRDMSSGKVKRLLVQPGSSDNYDIYGESPVLSPDSRQVVYQWEMDEEKTWRVQLRIMPNEPGSKARVLIDNAENMNTLPKAWFPDGKSVLLYIQKTDKSWQLARVQVSDGAVKVLKPLQWRLVGVDKDRPSISPDGQYVVYSALAANPSKVPPAASDSKDRHLYVVAADGSSETEIVKTSGINQNPAWTPDGKHILFTSDRSGKTDLWSMAVQNGKAAGVASLVSADVGDVVNAGLYGGSYYMSDNQPQGVDYIHVVDVAPDGAPHETESFVGVQPEWSPDGKSIAFKRLHPGSEKNYDLVVHSVGTGEERTYLTSLGATGEGKETWTHDGKAVVTGIHHPDGSRLLYRIDVKSGEFQGLQDTFGNNTLSPDDKTLYVALDKALGHVASVNLGTGQQREIFVSPVSGALSIALSPDGRTVALANMRSVSRVSVEGTGYRELYRRPDSQSTSVEWSSDGHSILFDQEQPGGGFGIMRIPAEGGPATLVFASRSMQRRTFNMSSDGSHLAFGSSEKSRALWALDNVLTALK